MADFSFDIVSEINWQELNNTVDQARREIATRYDFKGIVVEIKIDDSQLIITVPDRYKFKALMEIIKSKLISRGLNLKILGEEKLEKASGGSIRVIIKLIEGITQDQIKQINKMIREQMPGVKTTVQGMAIRVSSRSKNELQEIIQLLRNSSAINIPLQFVNYR